MIFQRYLLRELFSTWALWMMALTLVLFSVVAAKTFKQIDVQALDLITWIRLFGINGLRYLPYLLGIAAYLAAFNTSTRYWHEGEIWVWRNAGVTSALLLRKLGLFIVPMSLGIAILTAWAVPWSYRQGAIEQLAIARTPLTRFSEAGRFLHFPSGLTVRIEGKKTNNAEASQHDAHSVFVFRESVTGNQVQDSSIWAKSAQLEPQNERVILTLNEGILKQYQIHGTAGFIKPKVDMRFKSLRYLFSLPDTTLNDNPKWMSTSQLWISNKNPPRLKSGIQAERFWRLSFPFHVFIITWIAWSLGRHNTRSGQSAHVFSLILLDQLYLNLINLVQSNLNNGRWDMSGLLVGLLLHAAFTFVAWTLWLRQSR